MQRHDHRRESREATQASQLRAACDCPGPCASNPVGLGINLSVLLETLRVATVLLVHDNADVCRLLARLVRSCGHSADVAPGGQEAIDYFAAKRPDMVILDVMMPQVDGLEVLQFIRETPATAELPVILFTAVSEGEIREK